MYSFLKGFRVVEGASFIAAPSASLYLSQMGAEIIRFDDLSRSPDRRRWPLAPDGSSLYWEGLNKGKKSVALDLARPEGRQIAAELITAPGDEAGLFVTNYPVDGFLAHDKLAAKRPDLITLRLMGWADGRQAVDYTINSAVGVPTMTGPASLGDAPVNHVLPAWDLLAGAYGAFAMLAAERNRRSGGPGAEIRLPLSDVALSALGNLGQIAEVLATGADRPRIGNDLFGAFGRDFVTKDGKRVMIVAITSRQWESLVRVLELKSEIEAFEVANGVSLGQDEGARFTWRSTLFPLFEKAVSKRSLDDMAKLFDANQVCWSMYRGLSDALQGDIMKQSAHLFEDVRHPSGQTYPTPGAAATIVGATRSNVHAAPVFGADTEQVLHEVLGYGLKRVGQLVDDGVILKPGKA